MSTPIENVVGFLEFADAYITFALWASDQSKKAGLVQWHKVVLGRQNYTMQTSEHRMWVWEFELSLVYVGNRKGIVFEVSRGVSRDAAWTEWKNYLEKMNYKESL